MDFKKKTKATQILTGILTLSMIFGASFAGGYPVAAAGSCSAETDGQPMPKKKGNRTGTYVYDENKDEGYLDGEALDWDDEDWENGREWDHKSLLEEYAAHGMKRKGGSYYYKGKRVKVIKDQFPDSSFYKFDPKLKGAVSVKVVRNKKGNIKRISYLTKKEAARLIERAGLKVS